MMQNECGQARTQAAVMRSRPAAFPRFRCVRLGNETATLTVALQAATRHRESPPRGFERERAAKANRAERLPVPGAERRETREISRPRIFGIPPEWEEYPNRLASHRLRSAAAGLGPVLALQGADRPARRGLHPTPSLGLWWASDTSRMAGFPDCREFPNLRREFALWAGRPSRVSARDAARCRHVWQRRQVR